MNDRYADLRVKEKWSNVYKAGKWNLVELTVIQARAELGRVKNEDYLAIRSALENRPVDLAWWEARERETNHDYDSWCDERKRWIPPALQRLFHQDMTTYDGQDPAFVLILQECVDIVHQDVQKLFAILTEMANRNRYCIMMGKTHRQTAELQSFGKRCLTWLVELRISYNELLKAEQNLKFGKLAGTIGNYGLLDPELEKKVCEILGLEVIYGVTQLIPRELLVPVANALSQMAQTIHKIANDVCESTSGNYPICHVPFPKSGKGSSAMAWKRNPWRAEGMKGVAAMAQARANAINSTIVTAFERDMGQSCVERNEWCDIFHLIVYAMKTMSGVLEKLEIYPDNMLREIEGVHGTYAGLAARDFLEKFNFNNNEAYRIVQLASWIALRPTAVGQKMRQGIKTAEDAMSFLLDFKKENRDTEVLFIQEIISGHRLEYIPSLEPTPLQVNDWNGRLEALFEGNGVVKNAWDIIFSSAIARTFENEKILFENVLGT